MHPKKSMNGLKRNDYARLTKRKGVRERNESAPLKERCSSDRTILPTRDIMILFQKRSLYASWTQNLFHDPPDARPTPDAPHVAASRVVPFFILERISRVERQRL